jgi:copper chaperone CopZ
MALKRFVLPVDPDEDLADELRSMLTDLPGVGDVHVEAGEREVAVETDEDVLSDDEILAAIGGAGVEATPSSG